MSWLRQLPVPDAGAVVKKGRGGGCIWATILGVVAVAGLVALVRWLQAQGAPVPTPTVQDVTSAATQASTLASGGPSAMPGAGLVGWLELLVLLGVLVALGVLALAFLVHAMHFAAEWSRGVMRSAVIGLVGLVVLAIVIPQTPRFMEWAVPGAFHVSAPAPPPGP